MKRGMIGRMDARSLGLDTLAPWAEAVARPGPMTVNDLLALPDHDGWRYEVVEGALVRVAGSRPRAVRVTMRLLRALDSYVEEHELGQVTPPDAVYDFEHTGQQNTGLLPDIGFYVTDREALVEDDKPYPFAPDLAVEVVSPLQSTSDMAAKAKRYLRGGRDSYGSSTRTCSRSRSGAPALAYPPARSAWRTRSMARWWCRASTTRSRPC